MGCLNIRDFEAVAWDFDGVLADTIAGHTAARRQAYYHLAEAKNDPRFALISDEVHEEAHYHGSNPESINGWILEQAGITEPTALEDVVTQKDVFYRNTALAGFPPIPGAAHLLRAINIDRAGRQAIVTTARRWEVLPFLGHNNLTAYFPDKRLITRDHPEVTELKPAPDAYAIAGKALCVSRPENLLVFEDSIRGIEAAKRYGATVCAVATTDSYANLLAIQGDYKPDYICQDMHELADGFGYPKVA